MLSSSARDGSRSLCGPLPDFRDNSDGFAQDSDAGRGEGCLTAQGNFSIFLSFCYNFLFFLDFLQAAGIASSPRISTVSIVRKLVEEKGIMGMYKGLRATALRDVSFSLIFFPLFTNLNKIGPRKPGSSTEAVFWWSFLAGITAGSYYTLYNTLYNTSYGTLYFMALLQAQYQLLLSTPLM